MVVGEAAVTTVFDTFATGLTSQSVAAGTNLSMALPVIGENVLASSISVPVTDSADLKVATISTKASAYGSYHALQSDSISVTVLGAATTVVFTIQKNAPTYFKTVPSPYNFTEECGYGDFHAVNRTCPDSNTVISFRCKGWVESIVASCPGSQEVTTCASAVGGNQSCHVLSFSAENVTCQCALVPARGRRLVNAAGTVSTVVEKSGVGQLAAMSMFVGQQFAGTLSAAGSLNSAAAFRKVLIVIVSFAVLWIGGMVFLMSAAFRNRLHKAAHREAKQNVEKMKRYAQATRSPVAIREYLTTYVDQVFPSAFQNKPRLERFFDEVSKNHRYVMVLSCGSNAKEDHHRILTGVRLLTVQTMLMFLLAVFYDLQGPDDDGTCPSLVSETTCLARTSILDAHQKYCQWGMNPLRENVCTFNPPTISYLTIAYVSVLVSIVTAIFSTPIDMFFEYLRAPTADAVRVKASESLARKVMKRVAVGSIGQANATDSKINAEERDKMSRVANFETRELPESTRLAYAVAVAATPSITAKSHDLFLRRVSSRYLKKERHSEHRRHRAESHQHSDSESDSDEVNDDEPNEIASYSEESKNNSNQQSVARRRTSTMTAEDNADEEARKLFKELSDDIDLQRRHLPMDEVEEFDGAWGIDPTGEFLKRDQLSLCGYHRIDSAAQIRNEIKEVIKTSRGIADKLEVATDQHTGLEILHLFILDVLGRDTAAARIFESKAGEDFVTVRVVSRTTKMLAWCSVIFFNLFFVYFTIIKSYQKGVGWQRAYMTGCVTQFVIEIFFNETIDCIWVNYMVPSLVQSEVHRVADLLYSAIDQLCAPETAETNHFLDAPSYLYVSVAVAKKFPRLLESMVVRAFNSHLPGLLADKWHFGPVARINRSSAFRTFSLMATVLAGLQVAAASPFVIQRIVIRTVQPWLLMGIIVAAMFLLRNPVVLSLVVIVIAALLGYGLYRYFHQPTKASAIGTEESPNSPPESEHVVVVTSEEKIADGGEKCVYDNDRDEDSLDPYGGHVSDSDGSSDASGVEIRSPKSVRPLENSHIIG